MGLRQLLWRLIILCLISACSPEDTQKISIDELKYYQWNRLNFKEAGWKHEDIFFVNQNLGWVVVNDQGEIHKTEDGGKSWFQQFKPPERPYFRSIGFIDEKIGFAGNLTGEHRNTLYRTLDGGLNWSVVEIDSRVVGLCAIFVVDDETIYAAGKYRGPAYVIKSVDGGRSWSAIDMNHILGQATDIYFFNDQEGLLVGGSAADSIESQVMVLSTSDGGESWQERYRGPRLGEMAWKISFPSRDVGYVSIDSEGLKDVDTEYFLKTSDGGLTWNRMPYYQGSYRAQGIGFVTESIGWIGSFRDDRHTMVTYDGGVSWQETTFGNRINRIRFMEGTTGFAAGHWLYRFDKREISD